MVIITKKKNKLQGKKTKKLLKNIILNNILTDGFKINGVYIDDFYTFYHNKKILPSIEEVKNIIHPNLKINLEKMIKNIKYFSKFSNIVNFEKRFEKKKQNDSKIKENERLIAKYKKNLRELKKVKNKKELEFIERGKYIDNLCGVINNNPKDNGDDLKFVCKLIIAYKFKVNPDQADADADRAAEVFLNKIFKTGKQTEGQKNTLGEDKKLIKALEAFIKSYKGLRSETNKHKITLSKKQLASSYDRLTKEIKNIADEKFTEIFTHFTANQIPNNKPDYSKWFKQSQDLLIKSEIENVMKIFNERFQESGENLYDKKKLNKKNEYDIFLNELSTKYFEYKEEQQELEEDKKEKEFEEKMANIRSIIRRQSSEYHIDSLISGKDQPLEKANKDINLLKDLTAMIDYYSKEKDTDKKNKLQEYLKYLIIDIFHEINDKAGNIIPQFLEYQEERKPLQITDVKKIEAIKTSVRDKIKSIVDDFLTNKEYEIPNISALNCKVNLTKSADIVLGGDDIKQLSQINEIFKLSFFMYNYSSIKKNLVSEHDVISDFQYEIQNSMETIINEDIIPIEESIINDDEFKQNYINIKIEKNYENSIYKIILKIIKKLITTKEELNKYNKTEFFNRPDINQANIITQGLIKNFIKYFKGYDDGKYFNDKFEEFNSLHEKISGHFYKKIIKNIISGSKDILNNLFLGRKSIINNINNLSEQKTIKRIKIEKEGEGEEQYTFELETDITSNIEYFNYYLEIDNKFELVELTKVEEKEEEKKAEKNTTKVKLVIGHAEQAEQAEQDAVIISGKNLLIIKKTTYNDLDYEIEQFSKVFLEFDNFIDEIVKIFRIHELSIFSIEKMFQTDKINFKYFYHVDFFLTELKNDQALIELLNIKNTFIDRVKKKYQGLININNIQEAHIAEIFKEIDDDIFYDKLIQLSEDIDYNIPTDAGPSGGTDASSQTKLKVSELEEFESYKTLKQIYLAVNHSPKITNKENYIFKKEDKDTPETEKIIFNFEENCLQNTQLGDIDNGTIYIKINKNLDIKTNLVNSNELKKLDIIGKDLLFFDIDSFEFYFLHYLIHLKTNRFIPQNKDEELETLKDYVNEKALSSGSANANADEEKKKIISRYIRNFFENYGDEIFEKFEKSYQEEITNIVEGWLANENGDISVKEKELKSKEDENENLIRQIIKDDQNKILEQNFATYLSHYSSEKQVIKKITRTKSDDKRTGVLAYHLIHEQLQPLRDNINSQLIKISELRDNNTIDLDFYNATQKVLARYDAEPEPSIGLLGLNIIFNFILLSVIDKNTFTNLDTTMKEEKIVNIDIQNLNTPTVSGATASGATKHTINKHAFNNSVQKNAAILFCKVRNKLLEGQLCDLHFRSQERTLLILKILITIIRFRFSQHCVEENIRQQNLGDYSVDDFFTNKIYDKIHIELDNTFTHLTRYTTLQYFIIIAKKIFTIYKNGEILSKQYYFDYYFNNFSNNDGKLIMKNISTDKVYCDFRNYTNINSMRAFFITERKQMGL